MVKLRGMDGCGGPLPKWQHMCAKIKWMCVHSEMHAVYIKACIRTQTVTQQLLFPEIWTAAQESQRTAASVHKLAYIERVAGIWWAGMHMHGPKVLHFSSTNCWWILLSNVLDALNALKKYHKMFAKVKAKRLRAWQGFSYWLAHALIEKSKVGQS